MSEHVFVETDDKPLLIPAVCLQASRDTYADLLAAHKRLLVVCLVLLFLCLGLMLALIVGVGQ